MTRLRLEAVECFERDVKLRLPFRFGVITVTRSTQAVIRATIALEDGRACVGVAAETLGAKWFDKSRRSPMRRTWTSCGQSLGLAIDSYRARAGARHSPSTPAPTRSSRCERGPRAGAPGGLLRPALLDRAILDALGRADGSPSPT